MGVVPRDGGAIAGQTDAPSKRMRDGWVPLPRCGRGGAEEAVAAQGRDEGQGEQGGVCSRRSVEWRPPRQSDSASVECASMEHFWR